MLKLLFTIARISRLLRGFLIRIENGIDSKTEHLLAGNRPIVRRLVTYGDNSNG